MVCMHSGKSLRYSFLFSFSVSVIPLGVYSPMWQIAVLCIFQFVVGPSGWNKNIDNFSYVLLSWHCPPVEIGIIAQEFARVTIFVVTKLLELIVAVRTNLIKKVAVSIPTQGVVTINVFGTPIFIHGFQFFLFV
jgi:hypothetical protein